jgi:CBS domain-containing protein
MKTDLIVVQDSAPLSEVERVLAEDRVSGAPVVNGAGKVVGVVSMRDLVERYANDPDARSRRGTSSETDADLDSYDVPTDSEATAADVMTGDVHWIPSSAGLAEVAREMTRLGVHRLLVRDGNQYVGLVGTMDVLRALAG